MNYNIELTEKSLQPVLSIRTRTSLDNLPKEIGRAYKIIFQYLNEIGEQPIDAPFTAYYNLDMDNLDVEMGFPVGKPLAGKGEVVSSEISAGKFVSCIFKGSYKQMEPLYNAMYKWISENGYTTTGVSYEYYYNSPADVPESELSTKVVFPVK
ncbi:MAG: transcription activator [Clostridiales bacterium]|jgi:effector-binding domain-containing protein|nr:transcription activator [Clostridiales bacterium]